MIPVGTPRPGSSLRASGQGGSGGDATAATGRDADHAAGRRIVGTAVLAVILAGHSFQATFWWSVAFTALAVLPAAMLPRRARQGSPAAQRPGSPAAQRPGSRAGRRDPKHPAGDLLRPARRWHRDGPAGFGPDRPARVGLAEAPAAGAGGDHGEAPAALGHQVEAPRRRDGRAAVVSDRDPGHSVSRAVDLDREHAAAPRGQARLGPGHH